MMKHSFKTILFTVVIFVFFACARQQGGPLNPNPNPGGGIQPTLSSIQANVFTTTCGIAPCHVAGGIAPFRLDNQGQAFTNLVGVTSLHNPAKMRVASGNPANSYILDIIQGNGVNNAVMPPAGNNLLNSNQIQAISDWIAAGAPNN